MLTRGPDIHESFHSHRHPKDTIKTHVSSYSVPTFATDDAGQTSHSRTSVAMIDSTSAHPQAVANPATLETRPIFATFICYQLAGKKLGHLNGRLLCQIAQQFCPVVPWCYASRLMNVKVLPSLPASSELSGSTELRDLFRLIESRLSPELQLIVLSFISGLFKSPADSLATLNYIANQLPICEASHTSYRPFSHANVLEKIGVHTVDILGEICLKRIGEIDNSSSYHHEIIPPPSPRSPRPASCFWNLWSGGPTGYIPRFLYIQLDKQTATEVGYNV